MRARVAFDTLAYANRLKAAGVEPKVAEAQAEINADMVAALLDGDLATKSDLLQLESKLEHQIHEVQLEVTGLKSELKQDMKDLETRLTLRLGGIMIGCITMASVILSMLHAVHLA